jgi:DNA-binding LacI/PurR family transcriptional regulator
LSAGKKAHPDQKANEAKSRQAPVSLKELAQHLGVSPSTVSVVLNDVPGRSISEPTRARIRQAAEELGYRPSLLARSLRRQQTQTIAILLPLVGEEYHAQVLSGLASYLEEHGYSYLIAQHRHDSARVAEYTKMLISRGAEGVIAIDTHVDTSPHVPMVAVAGHQALPDVTNVVLDHDRAGMLTMQHLHDKGHRQIAVIKGQPASSDTETRWKATSEAAKKFGISIPAHLVLQLERNLTSPELAYELVRQLLAAPPAFTAIVCFNDIAALGAIRAVTDAGLQVPGDISVVGFDDIRLADFAKPSITTVHQPLQQMGELAARLLLDRLSTGKAGPHEVAVEPVLVARESTGDAPKLAD